MLNLSFLQSLPLAEEVYSDCTRYGNFEWQLNWTLEEKSRKLYIFAYPIENIIRPNVDCIIEVDIEGKVGSTSFVKEDAYVLYITENGEKIVSWTKIYEEDEETFCKEHGTLDGGVLVSLEVSNIRTKGLRKFPTIDFDKSVSGCSDSTIAIKDKNIHIHSQILRMNSKVFRKMFEKKKYMKRFEDSIIYEDFLELLHHIYHPAEIIDENNLRTILPLAKQFKAPQILEICQRFMEKYLSDLSVDKDSKIEYFFLAWKNDVEPLKTDCIKVLFPWDELSLTKLRHKQLYQNLDENQKLELLECLIINPKAGLC